jgi:lysozyme family protein
MATRAAIAADYQQKYDSMTITRPGAVDAAARRILKNWDAYKAVEAKTGVPAAFVGTLHMRECDNNMRGCLHNGELIIGTNRKTRLVPRGRGPFATWEEAAIDALKFDGFADMADMSMGALCEAAERYNGTGYRAKGRPSPYVWAGSQFYKSGKYIRDGVYSASAIDPQLGVAPVMKRVLELAPGTSAVAKVAAKRTEEKAVVKNSRALTWGERYAAFCEYLGLSWASAVTFIQGARDFLTDWRTLAVLGALGSAYVLAKYFKWNLLQAHKEGRYVPSGFKIPAADGDNANA